MSLVGLESNECVLFDAFRRATESDNPFHPIIFKSENGGNKLCCRATFLSFVCFHFSHVALSWPTSLSLFSSSNLGDTSSKHYEKLEYSSEGMEGDCQSAESKKNTVGT